MKILVLFCIIIFNTTAFAYDEDSHTVFSEHALDGTEIAMPEKAEFAQYGIIPYDQNPIFPIPRSLINRKNKCSYEIDGIKYCSIKELVSGGAHFEDSDSPDLRPLNHFYDPVKDRPLTVLGIGLGLKSPDWALEDIGDVDPNITSDQEYSYKDAMNCFYLALTSEEYQDRDNYYSCTFKNIGQVIHHIQDMAQPDHVRNDQHLDGLDSSWYEEYTLKRTNDFNDNIFKGYLANATYEAPIFNSAREYWTTRDIDLDISQRKGLSDFTNYNFVSKDTTFHMLNGSVSPNAYYENPIPGASLTSIDISDPSVWGAKGKSLCDNMVINNPDIDFPSNSCVMEFVSTIVTDSNTGQVSTNDRAATRSLFDKSLNEFNQNATIDFGDGDVVVDRLFTLNQINFNAAHEYLIPRAIAYSTGLINFFFKGNITAIPASDISDVNEAYIDKDGWKIMNLSFLKDSSGLSHNFDMEGEFQMYYWTYDNSIWRLKPLPGAKWHTNTNTTSGALDDNEWFMDVDTPLTLPGDLSSNRLRLVFKGRIGNEGDPNAASDINNTNYMVTADAGIEMYFSATEVIDYETSEAYLQSDSRTLYIASNNQLDTFNSNGQVLVTRDSAGEITDKNYRITNHVARGRFDNGNDYIVVEYNDSVTIPISINTISPPNSYYSLNTNPYYSVPSESLVSTLPYGYRVYNWEFGTISKYPNIYSYIHDESVLKIRHGTTADNSFYARISIGPNPRINFRDSTCRGYYLSDIMPSWPDSALNTYDNIFSFNTDNPTNTINNFILVDILRRSSQFSGNLCKGY